MVDNGYLLYFRWLELLVEPRKDSRQMGHFQQQPRGRGEPLSASYQDFLSTQPPLFHKANEPLDADA
jgi:hypothetical protein